MDLVDVENEKVPIETFQSNLNRVEEMLNVFLFFEVDPNHKNLENTKVNIWIDVLEKKKL